MYACTHTSIRTHKHMKPKANDIHDNPAASRTQKRRQRDDDDNKRARNHDDSQMRQQSRMCPANTQYQYENKTSKSAMFGKKRNETSTLLTKEKRKRKRNDTATRMYFLS